MANLSLARIMYGANKDFHASSGMIAPAFSSLKTQPDRENSDKRIAGSEPATLGELLHKAWTALTGKS
jgi:hypothetical protein